ncbi:MAG: class I SAM-dependent methyltransferase [Acidobacteriota bacterium]|nr:class I SAM-dependent methyltransferase [Acidobacteriota bacterium]
MARAGGAKGGEDDRAGGGGSGLRLVPAKVRPRDLLKLTSSPIHPFDQAHGVETSGLVPAKHLRTGSPSDEHVTAYYGVAPSILRALIAQWMETEPRDPISRYTFVDIGAGKGRALLVASEFAFRAVVGVELNPALAAVARANATEWARAHAEDATASGCAPIAVVEGDALRYELPAGPVLLFLFHPFEAPVLEQMMGRFAEQLARRRRPALEILYVNAECRVVLDGRAELVREFLGPVTMSAEDHAADLEAIAQQKEYGSTGDEECAIYRWVG